VYVLPLRGRQLAGIRRDVAQDRQAPPERAHELQRSRAFVRDLLAPQPHALHDVDLALDQFGQLALFGVVRFRLQCAELRDESIQLGGAAVTGQRGEFAIALLDPCACGARGTLGVAPEIARVCGKRRDQIGDRACVIRRVVGAGRTYLARPGAQQRRETRLVSAA
jgi:hypothetical protein